MKATVYSEYFVSHMTHNHAERTILSERKAKKCLQGKRKKLQQRYFVVLFCFFS